jgi:hypothetical protein
MENVSHVDIDGFMRCLVGTKSMVHIRCIAVYLKLELVESIGHEKESSERHTKTWKDKSSTKFI